MTQQEYNERSKAIMTLMYSETRKMNKAITVYEEVLRKTRDDLQKFMFDMTGSDINERDKEAVAIEYGKVANMVNNLNAIKALVNPF